MDQTQFTPAGYFSDRLAGGDGGEFPKAAGGVTRDRILKARPGAFSCCLLPKTGMVISRLV